MPFQLISASGTQHGLIINSDGSLNVGVSGTISANIDNVFVQSGTFFQTSGNVFVVSGNSWAGIGSVLVTNNPTSQFVPSGNIYVVSGNAWTGIGSVLTQNPVYVTSSGTLYATVSGAGNFSVTGSIVEKQVAPTNSAQNNPLFNLTFSGGVLTQAVQFIGAGSYVKNLSYSGTTLAQAGSWF